ncbi:HNH endonuclease [Nonomuraea sp. KM90]|uniref:HNH endonuclease n=1 Tax=Nonomuraea sp. KM90 TaxID=3457428 RepID=UPI003FCC65D9
MAYRKKSITSAIRRQVAVKYHCPPGASIKVPCHYCGALGEIWWWRLRSGQPSSWVSFDHEIDHVIPEAQGGSTAIENLVLACRPCNRRKGSRLIEGRRHAR